MRAKALVFSQVRIYFINVIKNIFLKAGIVMRQKIAKKITELVPDSIARSRRAKKNAWNKFNSEKRRSLSLALEKKNLKSGDEPTT
jgi:hypothetical protein